MPRMYRGNVAAMGDVEAWTPTIRSIFNEAMQLTGYQIASPGET